MKIDKIKSMAKKMGIKANGMNKTDLIRSIQKSEGNSDCFGRGDAKACSQSGCLWREDCLAV